MSDDSALEEKPTASITLPEQLPERARAAARLMQAAVLYAMDVLRMNADTISAVLNVDDLSFRRDGGRIDIMPALSGEGRENHPQDLLMEAALAFADAVADADADSASQEVPAASEG